MRHGTWCDVDLRIPILTSAPLWSILVLSGGHNIMSNASIVNNCIVFMYLKSLGNTGEKNVLIAYADLSRGIRHLNLNFRLHWILAFFLQAVKIYLLKLTLVLLVVYVSWQIQVGTGDLDPLWKITRCYRFPYYFWYGTPWRSKFTPWTL